MSAEINRLYRSRSERMIGGVCGGLGKFLGLDPTVVRLLFVLSLFLWPGPAALIAYLILLIIVPEEPLATPVSPIETAPEANSPE